MSWLIAISAAFIAGPCSARHWHPPGALNPRPRLAVACATDSKGLGVADVAAADAAADGGVAATAAAGWRGPLHAAGVLWRFSRPHTLIGSALCIPALSLYAAPPGAAISSAVFVPLVLYAMVPSLLVNVYITGLNQLFDIPIDRVNKPTLPLASGEMSPAVGAATVLLCLAGGLALGWAFPPLCSPALRATLCGSALLGTAYSCPPVRLKRSPLLASLCIMSVRGALINWGFFAHAAEAYGASVSTAALQAWRCAGPVAFFTLFGALTPTQTWAQTDIHTTHARKMAHANTRLRLDVARRHRHRPRQRRARRGRRRAVRHPILLCPRRPGAGPLAAPRRTSPHLSRLLPRPGAGPLARDRSARRYARGGGCRTRRRLRLGGGGGSVARECAPRSRRRRGGVRGAGRGARVRCGGADRRAVGVRLLHEAVEAVLRLVRLPALCAIEGARWGGGVRARAAPLSFPSTRLCPRPPAGEGYVDTSQQLRTSSCRVPAFWGQARVHFGR